MPDLPAFKLPWQKPPPPPPPPPPTSKGAIALPVPLQIVGILAVQTYAPRVWRALRLSTLLHAPPIAKLLKRKGERKGKAGGGDDDSAPAVVSFALSVLDATSMLETFFPAVVVFEGASLGLRLLIPTQYRALRFWRFMMPIFTSYVRTKQSTRKLSQDKRDEVWAVRHEWGGAKVYNLVLTMSGFYVKSAQILGSKADFMPEQWTKRLRPLFDDHPPERRFHVVARAVERYLSLTERGRELLPVKKIKGSTTLRELVFDTFEPEALAAASIGQVHRATLADGTSVVVKVQKLGVDGLIKSDLANMKLVARFLRPYLPFDITPIADESIKQIPKEFDFERESRMQMEIRVSLNNSEYGEPHVYIPLAYRDLSTTRLLVMEFMEGVPFSKLLKEEQVAHDARLMKLRGLVPGAFQKLLLAYGHMMFVDGKFHADPHAGNLMMRDDGSVIMLDFGQTKVLDDESKIMLAQLVDLLAVGDKDEICNMMDEALSTMKKGGGDADKDTVIKIAYSLFDTRYIAEAQLNPFGDDSLTSDTDITFNSNLWMIVRLILLLRGMFHDFGIDNVSAVEIWHPFAQAVLDKLHDDDDEPAADESTTDASATAGTPAPANGSSAGPMPAPVGSRKAPTMTQKARLVRLARWLGQMNLPNDREAMKSIYLAGIEDVETMKRMKKASTFHHLKARLNEEGGGWSDAKLVELESAVSKALSQAQSKKAKAAEDMEKPDVDTARPVGSPIGSWPDDEPTRSSIWMCGCGSRPKVAK
ncbi:hypothetical protein PPROV_000744100 [Pycnococcus provasolii]|uniref:Protein kinase domain-containing protein n=1 Tax=Pycnococcus provasolii TaxID=41880 RepID=A0A830HNF9_9CHLO|nr:hypothetical protein PPROV_000744100 [Pycnococcus provasolii]